MLIDESQSMLRKARIAPPTPPRFGDRLRELAKRLLPETSWNLTGSATLTGLAVELTRGGRDPLVLILGAKHRKASTAALLDEPSIDCVEADVDLGRRANIVFDFQRIPFADGVFDLVVLDAILEHVPEPRRVVDEVHRTLRADGLVYSDSPFMLQVHGGAYDFLRFSPNGHRWIFRRFREVESGVTSGPGAALASSVQYFLLGFVRRRSTRFAIKTLCRCTLFWLKYFDRILPNRPGMLDGALGLYFVGRRSEVETSVEEMLSSYRGITPDLYSQRHDP